MAVLGDANTDGRVADRRAVERKVALVSGSDNPILLGRLGELLPQQVEELARGVRTRLIQGGGEAADHLVCLPELLFVGEDVVHAIDEVLLQQDVVDLRRALEVVAPQGFVDIVEQVGAGGNQAVDEAVFDEIDHGAPQTCRHHGPRHTHHDHHPVAEHLFPDVISGGQIPALEGDALHLLQQRRDVLASVDFQRSRRRRENLSFVRDLAFVHGVLVFCD